jgi:AcrR family transcriptional regulator
MPRPPSPRRAAILEAALDCFTNYGFAKTTMDDIRVRAGASTGSLYHHFKSKEQLAAELYVEGVSRYQAGLGRELARHDGAEAGIRGVVRHYLRWVERHPRWAGYLAQSRQAELVAETEPAMRELNARMKREFADWVRPFVAAGDVLDLPGDVYVALLMGPAQAYARMRQSGRARTDLATASLQLEEAAWKSLRTQKGAAR